MEHRMINNATLERIFNMMRGAVMTIKGDDFPKDSIKIFMPFYLKRLFERWAEKQHYYEGLFNKKTFLLLDIEVINGYEQNKVIITNCFGPYPPEHVIHYVISYTESDAVVNAGLFSAD
jgi:hypothetical protein